jgi:hypothetical protein
LFPDSSAVEQLTVNQLVRGSIPRQGAISFFSSMVTVNFNLLFNNEFEKLVVFESLKKIKTFNYIALLRVFE